MAGGWLRWFHGQSEISPEPFQSEIYISTLAKVRDQLQAAAPETFAKDKFLNGYVDQAIRIAAEIEGTLLPHATAHGDFTPSNVFIRGKQVVGFDYAANRRLPVTHDICRFMLYLDVASRLPARARDLGEYGCNPEIYQAFSGRYGIDPELMESGRWIKFQFMEVARRMAAIKLTRARHKGGKNPFRALEMMRLRRNAKQISARITSAG